MNTLKKANIPTVIVVFGATGDLMEKKIAPSLLHLYKNGKLPTQFKIVGVARKSNSDGQFQKLVGDHLKKHSKQHPSKEKFKKFLDYFTYQSGQFQEPKTYSKLSKKLKQIDDEWGVCTNKLFYLAVPPKFYQTIFNNLSASGLTKPCSEEEGWTRVLVEKPFGSDLKTAKELEEVLGKLFREEQIFRIDHYLAKEMLQNILAVRFSNNLFEQTFNNRFIDSIELYLHEKKGAEGRGSFYDSVGTLKDVGQNHLLQMLALVTMDMPQSYNAKHIRDKRYELMKHLIPLKKSEMSTNTFRAQYEGYTQVEGVNAKSKTETFFKLQCFLNHPRWRDVPITIESGKGMAAPKKGIALNLKHTMPCLCPKGSEHYRNKIILTMEPEEGITIEFWAKKPGFQWQIEKKELKSFYRKNAKQAQYTEEYEKLLFDCIVGDQTLFVSTKEVLAMWKFIDPIVKAWESKIVSLEKYKKGSKTISTSVKFSSTKVKDAGQMPLEIGIVGLGKMGGGLARQLLEKGWKIHGYNRSPEETRKLKKDGLIPEFSLEDMVKNLPSPKIVWLMVPSGKPVDENINKLAKLLGKGDYIIDGGNSFFQNTVKRSRKVTAKKINFMDCGVSGGPEGARHGACLMIGGKKVDYDFLKPLYSDLAIHQGEEFFPGYGAGHFVKMVHNGIEYGMMQSIAEGFAIMRKSKYKLHLRKIAEVYNHGSVIESSLINWMGNAFALFGDDLKGVSGRASHSGEGLWTTQVAHSLGISDKVIHESLKARERSQKKPSYQGKIIQALRNQFGGHNLKK